ncbi:DUF2690 domain-containing protein [Streptosporangium soli]|nr:YjfA family protein [Streptosporangium sp. KLBMP 9127]
MSFHKMARKMALFGAGTLVVLSGVSLTAPPASAGDRVRAGCDGQGCNGRDPIQAGCVAGSYTAARVSTYEGLFELKYSPACHANWAKVSGSYPGVGLWVQNTNGDVEVFNVPKGHNNAYTDMVNGYPRARAGGASGHTAWA